MADFGNLDGLGQSSLQARFGEASKLLPVSLVLSTVVILYFEYVFLHCLRLLQWDLPDELRKQEDAARGYTEMVSFHVVTGMLLYCLARCILTNPGTVPDGKGWELQDREDSAEGGESERAADLVEKKHTGERRHCKWCLKYKPDRCHHCRICNLCILRMDHHCPWVYNCIGFRNHKFFFLLLVYAVIDLLIVNLTMFDTVWWSTRTDVSISMMILLMFGETLATFLMVLIVSFLSFHIWLMSKAMTTVEFCEKSLKKTSYNSSVYSQGTYRNICAVLGPQPLLWLLPFSLPEGDGLSWSGGKGEAAASSEAGRGARESLLARDPEARRESALSPDEDLAQGNARSSRKKREGTSRNQPQAAG